MRVQEAKASSEIRKLLVFQAKITEQQSVKGDTCEFFYQKRNDTQKSGATGIADGALAIGAANGRFGGTGRATAELTGDMV